MSLNGLDLEKAEPFIDSPKLKFKDEETNLYPEEIVALTVTRDMESSKEFVERIENWIKDYMYDFLKEAKRRSLNKAQELEDVVQGILSSLNIRRIHFIPMRGPLVLKKVEKERLLNWSLFLDRYGEKNTKFIFDLVEIGTLKLAEYQEVEEIGHWIRKTVRNYLEKEGLIESFMRESFWE
jgi:hypothetical protein